MQTVRDELVKFLGNGAEMKALVILGIVLIVALSLRWILSKRKSRFVLTVEKLNLEIGEPPAKQGLAPNQNE